MWYHPWGLISWRGRDFWVWQDPKILHCWFFFLSAYYICFLLLLVYTLMGVGNRFLVLINIENDTSLKQIGYNYNVDFPVFGQNRGSKKRAWPITRKRKVGGLWNPDSYPIIWIFWTFWSGYWALYDLLKQRSTNCKLPFDAFPDTHLLSDLGNFPRQLVLDSYFWCY